jgi:hypothetical protein
MLAGLEQLALNLKEIARFNFLPADDVGRDVGGRRTDSRNMAV